MKGRTKLTPITETMERIIGWRGICTECGCKFVASRSDAVMCGDGCRAAKYHRSPKGRRNLARIAARRKAKRRKDRCV